MQKRAGKSTAGGHAAMYYSVSNKLVNDSGEQNRIVKGLTGQAGPAMTTAATAHHTLGRSRNPPAGNREVKLKP